MEEEDLADVQDMEDEEEDFMEGVQLLNLLMIKTITSLVISKQVSILFLAFKGQIITQKRRR